MNDKYKNIKAILICLLGFTCFSFGDATYKWLSSGYHVFFMTFIASIASLAIILAAATIKGEFRNTFTPERPYAHLFRGLIMFLQFATFITGISHMDLAKAYTIAFVTPFITTLMAMAMFNEKANKHQWIAIIGGFIGVLTVLRPGIIEIDIWTLCILASACFISFANLYARKITSEKDSTFTLPASVSIVTILITLILIPTTTDGFLIPDITTLSLLIFAGSISAAGLYFVPKAFTMAPASIVAPMHYVQILWAILFGIFIFEEQSDPYTFIGATIIIISGIYLLRKERK